MLSGLAGLQGLKLGMPLPVLPGRICCWGPHSTLKSASADDRYAVQSAQQITWKFFSSACNAYQLDVLLLRPSTALHKVHTGTSHEQLPLADCWEGQRPLLASAERPQQRPHSCCNSAGSRSPMPESRLDRMVPSSPHPGPRAGRRRRKLLVPLHGKRRGSQAMRNVAFHPSAAPAPPEGPLFSDLPPARLGHDHGRDCVGTWCRASCGSGRPG